MTTYKALYIQEVADKHYQQSIVDRPIEDLPEGDVLIKVYYSSLNFKDAMSSQGNKGVTRQYPHQPGVDAAGVVVTAGDSIFNEGDEVIVTGYDLGMNTAGGLGEYIRVPAQWVVQCPVGLSLKQSMQLGTAGVTAQLCISKLEQMGLCPDQGPVLVTGATGGVGSIAVALLANAGYKVVASTGKAEQADFLQSLGASEIIDRKTLSEENKRPMLKELYAGVVDVAGGDTLANVIKMVKAGGSVACCGLVQAPDFSSSVFPFILRGVNLLGVDSVEIALADKQLVWKKLAPVAAIPALTVLNKEINLEQVPEALMTLFNGGMLGHRVVKVSS